MCKANPPIVFHLLNTRLTAKAPKSSHHTTEKIIASQVLF